jgi:hypothetical protein
MIIANENPKLYVLKIRVYELSQLQHLKVDSIVIENPRLYWLKIRVYELSQLQHLKVDLNVIENCQTFLARDMCL